MRKINDLYSIEKPIEKLLENGSKSLSEIELLAIILGTGNRKENVLELSKKLYRVLNNFSETEHAFTNLHQLTYEQLISIFGIGKVKACRILAITEIIKRAKLVRPNQNSENITTPEKASIYFQNELENLDHEEVHMISLNTKRKIIKYNIVAKGGLKSCILEPRDVFRTALLQNAAAIILAHNHPSGDPKPSHDDICTTKIYAEIGRKLGIQLEDHLVIANKEYISIRSLFPDAF